MPFDIASLFLPAAAEPAGGAEPLQVAIATAGASVATFVLIVLAQGHRSGRLTLLTRAAAYAERVSGLPGWAALPAAVAALALNVALLGMYWDIALHIDQGRDAGPLANPAHYFILAGLFGIFTAGVLSIVLPVGVRPGRASIRITRDWYAPVGGVLTAVCGAFALVAFPLDDVWHRLFGQDVTLWGPTHLMLIGGAGLSLIGQALMLSEGMHVKRGSKQGRRLEPTPRRGSRRFVPSPQVVTITRRVGLMGGLLIGLSTFQAEFDFGVPQYRLLFQPILIAGAAGCALVAARLWIGRGGALGAAAFFIALRGLVSLIVGPVIGETTPSLPLYLGEALCVELAALLFARRPLAAGAASGVLIGTVGLASEWAWSHAAMRLPWTTDLLPEAVPLAIVAGVAGGVLGALLALGLRAELPRAEVARPAAALAFAALACCAVVGLSTTVPESATATVALDELQGGSARSAQATVKLDPPSVADDPAWVTVTAWQGGGLHVDRLERIGEGVYRTTKPIPLHGNWKSLVRVQDGRRILGVPVYMPADPAIPAAEVPAPASFERRLVDDNRVLQRERDFGVPGWLWGGASLVVLALFCVLLGALGWGVGRVSRRNDPGVRQRAQPPRRVPNAGHDSSVTLVTSGKDA